MTEEAKAKKQHPYYTFCFESKWSNDFYANGKPTMDKIMFKKDDADDTDNLKEVIENDLIVDTDPKTPGSQKSEDFKYVFTYWGHRALCFVPG